MTAAQTIRRAGITLLIGVLGAMCGCTDQAASIAALDGRTMGTTYSVQLSPAPDPATLDELRGAIEARLAEVNGQMSTYLPDSDLSRFNTSTSTDWHEVPAPLAALVAQAHTISERSAGVYDVTVGPLVELWGFGAAGPRDTPPSDAQVTALLDRVGYRKLQHRDSPPALRKAVGRLRVDLSSIAKGWAVDEIARLLEARGLTDYLVEIGGDLRAGGQKSNGQPWRIAVESPLAGLRAVQRVVALQDQAIATSGDYRNFFDAGGRRYSHTIDPRSGYPVSHRLASVSVFADDCATADGWATALMALGEQAAPRLAKRIGLKALFVVRDDAGLRERLSPALAATGWLEAAELP